MVMKKVENRVVVSVQRRSKVAVVIVNNDDTCLADLPPLVTCRKRKEEYISVEGWYVTLSRGHYYRGRKELEIP
jgi:hypothetical protein